MKHAYFQYLETLTHNDKIPLNEVIVQLAFNENGLIPVITQDVKTKDVLMMAWMNKEALEKTLISGRMTYWSRSRNKLWVKGETSKHIQELVNMSFDCDGDAILCQVKQTGVACHTGRPSCFFLQVNTHKNQVNIIGFGN